MTLADFCSRDSIFYLLFTKKFEVRRNLFTDLKRKKGADGSAQTIKAQAQAQAQAQAWAQGNTRAN